MLLRDVIPYEKVRVPRLVCGGVPALAPHALTATTLNVYGPGPTVPLNARPLVAPEPTTDPVTFST